MKNGLRYILSTIIAGFGLLTLFLSASVIFDWFGMREKEGNYVLFVVWANFLASIIYLLSAYGFALSKKWTTNLLGTSVIILIITLLGLFYHINAGGDYETKTVGALIFRISVTLLFTTISYFMITRRKTIVNI
jgi:hypothetical protein